MQQDNAREKWLFEERMARADWKLVNKLEYMVRGTPQHNSPVEIGFATQAQLAQLAKEFLSLGNKNCNPVVINSNNKPATSYEQQDKKYPNVPSIFIHMARLESSKL